MKSEERLSAGLSKVRTKSGSENKVERWLMIGGGVLLLLGLAVIFLGWWGASHTPLLFEQVPYMISGGLLGLALVFGGGFTYFAYWLTRLNREVRQQGRQNNRVLEEIAEMMATFLREGVPGQTAASSNGAFVATQNGSMFHKPTCPVVSGKSDLRAASPSDPGMEPCKMCDPLGTTGKKEAAASS